MQVLLLTLACSSAITAVALARSLPSSAGTNTNAGRGMKILKTKRNHQPHAFVARIVSSYGHLRQRDRIGMVTKRREMMAAAKPVLVGREEEPVMMPEKHSLTTELTELESLVTREPFTGPVWMQSCEHLVRVAGSLASSVPSFSDSPHLPAEHGGALSLVVHLTERCRRVKENGSGSNLHRGEDQNRGGSGGEVPVDGLPTGLHPSLKFCTKKNGLGKAAAEVAAGFLPRYECVRERAKAIRGVERCLSEFCMVWSTARLLESRTAPETKSDFMFHLKALLEHAPACDRHEAVLVLCRGLFTPASDVIETKLRQDVHGAAFDREKGGYPLADAFAEVLEGTSEYPRALRASRQAFPFLEILTRWAWRCHVPPEPAAVPSRDTNAPERTGSRGQADRSILRAALEGGTEIAPGGCWSDRGELGTGRVGSRGRGDTGVASLLVAMAKDDPSGETIRSMQRWACQALVPEQVGQAPWSAIGTPVDRNEVGAGQRDPEALGLTPSAGIRQARRYYGGEMLTCTRQTFVLWEETFHLRWMRSCREVGEVLRLLVSALDKEELKRGDLTRMANHAMFVTTFLRSMPEGAKARRGYERLIGSGRVPGETLSFSADRGSRERVASWRDAAEVLDLSMASILRVSEEKVRSEGFQSALSSVLRSWRSPHALADFYNMHVQQKREVVRKYLRFLRALLNASDETLHDIRFKDPANTEHMQYVPERARQIWEAEPCKLAGTSDPEVIFRMGEDTRSCMGIRRACCKTNGALLGYLLQGNVRFVGVQSALGRMEARAVLRLLLRADNMTAVLFRDEIYYSSQRDDALESQVLLEATSVSDALGIPLYSAGDTLPRPSDDGVVSFDPGQESDGAKKVCELIEMNGLSDFVYSDAPIGLLERAGMLQRESYPGQPSRRRLVLAELAYA